MRCAFHVYIFLKVGMLVQFFSSLSTVFSFSVFTHLAFEE